MAAGPVLPLLVSGLNRNIFFLELLLEQRYTELNPFPPSTVSLSYYYQHVCVQFETKRRQ